MRLLRMKVKLLGYRIVQIVSGAAGEFTEEAQWQNLR